MDKMMNAIMARKNTGISLMDLLSSQTEAIYRLCTQSIYDKVNEGKYLVVVKFSTWSHRLVHFPLEDKDLSFTTPVFLDAIQRVTEELESLEYTVEYCELTYLMTISWRQPDGPNLAISDQLT